MSTKTIQVAMYQIAKGDQALCGDSYFYQETENVFVCAIADGLGSGEFAKESSRIVIDIIKDNIHLSNEMLLEKCNENLSGHRGVVLGILKLDLETKTYTYLSIGNIGLMTLTENKHKNRLIPNPGYLSGYKRPFKIVHDKLEKNMNFFMFSDGVTDRELAESYFMTSDIYEIVRTFKHLNPDPRPDDTTLIAMRYEG